MWAQGVSPWQLKKNNNQENYNQDNNEDNNNEDNNNEHYDSKDSGNWSSQRQLGLTCHVPLV